MRRFRLLEETLPTIEENLALDEALLAEAEATGGDPVLRIWAPDQWAVVLGASGRIEAEVRVDACRSDGVVLARRSSGGGTVVVGPGVVNVTVVLPKSFAAGLETVEGAQSYILERFAESIREVEPRVRVLGSGDLTIDGRKFAGSAQRRLKEYFLVHASLLGGFPLERLDRYLTHPSRQPAYREGRPHSEFVCNLELPAGRLRERLLTAWRPLEGFVALEDPPTHRIPGLVEGKFGDPKWVERF